MTDESRKRLGHSEDCGWHLDQYPWECSCGVFPRLTYAEWVKQQRGNSRARALLQGVKIAEADLKEAGVLLSGVVPGLKDVQEALPTRNPWAVLNFLVRPDDRLDGRKPIEVLLNGDVDLVVSAARSMGEH